MNKSSRIAALESRMTAVETALWWDGPRQPAAPAEQPAPAADLRREIEAAMGKVWQPLGDVDTESKLFALADKLTGGIEAAAAVPPADSPYIETLPGYAKGYNAGQSSILAPMLAELTQGGK